MRRLVPAALLALLLSGAGAPAGEPPSWRGRPLVDALEDLRARGLRLIYSTQVAREELLVTVEPAASEPRAILDEILAPLGLEARPGPGDSILIVAAARESADFVRGRIISASGGAPVAGASVAIAGTALRTTSGADGLFEIGLVPFGEARLLIEALGFAPLRITRLRVPSPAAQDLVVPLQTMLSYLAEVIVTPGRLSVVREEQALRRTIGAEEALLVPTIGGDISRVIELLPGVTSPDNSAAFNVRGSTAQDVSLVLDGHELYEPFHLLSFQSPFSFIDSKIVESIDFIGGGPTADLGDRHGGFVELYTDIPREGETAAAIELGTLNSRFSVGGRLPRVSGSWLASVRGWYPEAVGRTFDLGENNVNTRFGDAYAKANFDLPGGTFLSVHGLIARDRLEFTEVMVGEEVTTSNRSWSLWVRALKSWPAGVESQTILSGGRIVRRREGISEPEVDRLIVEDDRKVDIVGIKNDTTWAISPKHLLRAGFDVRRVGADYDYTVGLEGDPAASTNLRLHPAGGSYAAYVAHRTAITPDLATEVGLRWDRQSLLSDDQISPRLNALWRMNDRTDLRLAFGRYYQSQRIHELRIEDGETRFDPAEQSQQGEVTLRRSLPAGARLQVDAYYKTISNPHPRYENALNPIELFPETESDRVRIAPEHARLRGVEVLLNSGKGGPFDWWASYVWSSAEDVVDGQGQPRSWDQTHTGKVLVGWHPNDRSLISLSGTARTGWPTTPVTGRLVTLPDGTTEIVAVRGDRNSDRFPEYYRLDLKATQSFVLPRGRLQLELDVVNLANRKNVCCVEEYLFEQLPDGTIDAERVPRYWLGFTPSFSIRWEF